MINTEDEINIDLQTSVTKEGATARMLGWIKGHTQQKYVQITENGIPTDLLKILPFKDSTLMNGLQALRETARLAFIESAEAGESISITREKEEAVEQCDEQISQAVSYLLDIEDEIAKGDSSGLNIDRHRTDKTGIIHITLKSLDRWARKNYGISILDQSPKPVTENPSTQPESPQQNEPGTKNQPAQHDLGQEEESGQKGSLGRVKAENLYTTFAFLVEAFAETATLYGKNAGKPNVSAIAKHIKEIAFEASKPNKILGQGHETIKTCIENAMKIKEEKVRENKTGQSFQRKPDSKDVT